MKKELHERAFVLRKVIAGLNMSAGSDYSLHLMNEDDCMFTDATKFLSEGLRAKVDQWNKELKTLIAEEIAVLEKEFAELSDETMTEE